MTPDNESRQPSLFRRMTDYLGRIVDVQYLDNTPTHTLRIKWITAFAVCGRDVNGFHHLIPWASIKSIKSNRSRATG